MGIAHRKSISPIPRIATIRGRDTILAHLHEAWMLRLAEITSFSARVYRAIAITRYQQEIWWSCWFFCYARPRMLCAQRVSKSLFYVPLVFTSWFGSGDNDIGNRTSKINRPSRVYSPPIFALYVRRNMKPSHAMPCRRGLSLNLS